MPPKEDSVETQCDHLDSRCDALKAKTRTVHSRPVGKTISGECSLHQNLMPSLQATREESEFVNEKFAGSYPSDRDGYLLKGKTPNKAQEKQPPILVELLADNLAMETKLANPAVEHPQDKTFWEEKEAITTRDSHDISSYTVHKGMEKGRPPLIRRLTGQSPSEHLERMLSTHITQEALARRPLGPGHRATDPGHLTSSFWASLKTSEEYPWQSIESGIVTSQSPSPFTKDALKRVSQEEDVASLASLAQVLLSQGNNELKFATASDIDAEPSSEVDVANNMLDEKGAAKVLAPHIARSEKRNTAIEDNSAVEPLNHKSRTSGRATETNNYPSTPKRPMTTDPSITPKGRMGSVKSLAAKFNSADRGTDTISSSSPTRSPILGRGKLGLQAQNSILSNYTTNASPVSPARNSSKSSRSFTTVRNLHTPDKMAVSPMQPPLHSGLDVSHPKFASRTNGSPRAETPSRWRTLRQGKKYRVDTDSCSTMSCTNNLFQILPSLQRSGEGNGSSDVTRHPSMGTVLPRPAEPPVAQHLNLARPPSTPLRNVPRPSNGPRSSNGSYLTSPQPFSSLVNPTPSGSPFGIGFHGRDTSMLYSQITNLQRLLEARTEEVDHLRRQLATKDSLNDLGTLTEQLREEKRETTTWRKRAEMAEKRLERLSQLTSIVKSNNTSEEPMLLGPDASRREVNEMNIRAEQGFQAIIRAVLHGGTDGAVGSEESADSHGTIRRIIPKYRQMSEEDLILFLDTDELLPVLNPTSTDVVGLCELP